MSIHLVGGGGAPEHMPTVIGPFIAESAARAAGSARMLPRVSVVLVDDDPAEPADAHRYLSMLTAAGAHEPVLTRVPAGGSCPSSVLTGIDGLLIGGGSTPAYHAALEPLYDEIRLLVADGLPYLGFSAGAMIASEHALLGGWRVDGIAVCPEDAGEDLDEVTVVEGLGLVDLAIDVHAAQWGTLSRLVAAVESGLVPGGVAIDEDTTLVVGDALNVVGAGNVWQVVDGPDGVLVGALGGSDGDPAADPADEPQTGSVDLPDAGPEDG